MARRRSSSLLKTSDRAAKRTAAGVRSPLFHNSRMTVRTRVAPRPETMPARDSRPQAPDLRGAPARTSPMSSCGTTVAAVTRPTAVGSRARADPRLLGAARGARRAARPGPGPVQRHRHLGPPAARGGPAPVPELGGGRARNVRAHQHAARRLVGDVASPAAAPRAPPPIEPEAPTYGTSPTTTAPRLTARRAPRPIDLFERAATPIGTVERAEAALAASRAMQTKGIIKVNPGSTVKREKPPPPGPRTRRSRRLCRL